MWSLLLRRRYAEAESSIGTRKQLAMLIRCKCQRAGYKSERAPAFFPRLVKMAGLRELLNLGQLVDQQRHCEFAASHIR
jgi:hypothetical protein